MRALKFLPLCHGLVAGHGRPGPLGNQVHAEWIDRKDQDLVSSHSSRRLVLPLPRGMQKTLDNRLNDQLNRPRHPV